LSQQARHYLETIHRAIQDVANTVSRMREFSRPQEAQRPFTQLAINELVREVIELTEARWRDLPQERGIMIALNAELMDEPPCVLGADNEIRDALTNLVFNAVDAMPEGGELTIRLRLQSSEEAGEGASEEPKVVIEVTDTGAGMSEEVRQRCHEPFFTTKGDRGTGLGLASVYGMVQRHRGRMEIDSKPGLGTTVRLVIPSGGGDDRSAESAPSADGPLSSLRLLVVDDDPLVRTALERILTRDGHGVTTAKDGPTAIDLFLAAMRSGEPFSLVITDLGMPHMDGRKVAAALKQASPGTPVLLLTGWGQRMSDQDGLPPCVDGVLSKPPRLRDLRAALDRLAGDTRRLRA
jgi:CheY-like chemotaxis protein